MRKNQVSKEQSLAIMEEALKTYTRAQIAVELDKDAQTIYRYSRGLSVLSKGDYSLLQTMLVRSGEAC